MQTWADPLFYFVFLGQIFLLSYYIPNLLLSRGREVMDRYPPSEFPKLYPMPEDQYKTRLIILKAISRATIVVGFAILLMVMLIDKESFAEDGYISEIWPLVYAIVQAIPVFWAAFAEAGHYRGMRKNNESTTRSAELRPRRLLDYVPLRLVAASVLLFVGFVYLELYLHDFALGRETFSLIFFLVLSIALIAMAGAWTLYGPKLDPHQSFEDRSRQISIVLHSLIYASMAASMYFVTAALDQAFDLDYLDAPLLSLYLQVVMLFSIGYVMRMQRPEDIDFEVYRADPRTDVPAT